MSVNSAYVGEDVPVTILYTDSDGAATDPDDPAVTWPTIEITDLSDDSTALASTVMSQNGTGDFEHVWDTSGETAGTTYEIVITAEFSSETKINKATIELA